MFSCYDLELILKLDICKFDGKMIVFFCIVEDIKYIVFNVVDFIIIDKFVWL